MRIFVCTRGTDSNTSVFHGGAGAFNDITDLKVDIQMRAREITQCEVVAMNPASPSDTGFYLFRFTHYPNESYTEWMVSELDHQLKEVGDSQTLNKISQQIGSYRFKFLCTKVYDTTRWEAVAHDLLTNKTFFVRGYIDA